MADHEHLAAAAEKMGLPESLALRSAEAKAKAAGVSVDDILAEWAGVTEGTPAAAPAAPEPEPEPADPEPAEAAEPAEPAEAPVPAVVEPVADAELAETDEPLYVEVEYLPTPETVSPEEALEWDQVTTIKAAGLTEKTTPSVPTWLVAVFALVPLFAVFWISFNTEGFACGNGGQLTVDWAGNLANCDGTAYEVGGGGGGEVTAVFAEGQGIYDGQCASCHGAGGGGGVGPALSGGAVLTTFGACTDHVEWVTLGSSGWPDSSYGDSAKPVGGGMPGFGGSLSEEELAAVVLYERVAFGQQPLEDSGVDCGVIEAAGGDGTDGASGTDAGGDGTDTGGDMGGDSTGDTGGDTGGEG